MYKLPPLPYDYDSLEPVISSEQLEIHYEKHHKAYVDNANELVEKLEKAKEDGADIDFGAIAKKLSFNLGGHILHSLFWENMRSSKEGNGPDGKILEKIKDDFGSYEKFWQEFYNVATTVEGSGWTVLAYDSLADRLIILQIQNHNFNIVPTLPILLALDMWEHAYYLDYKNDKKKFAESFARIIDWSAVEERLATAQSL